MSNGDSYKRIEVAPGVYQCGCRFAPRADHGDTLVECPIHRQATAASVRQFERERAKDGAE